MKHVQNTEFFLETRLKDSGPWLHERLQENIIVINRLLNKYFDRFPTFTDHSILHSMQVLYYCNQLIGPVQIDKLSPEECYVLVMSCYLHDIGMGITDKELISLREAAPFLAAESLSDPKGISSAIRKYHNELSGIFIKKYGDLLEIPSKELEFAIVQVCRGHRKTDLFDGEQYPDLCVDGRHVRTAMLSAIMRLADEMDVDKERNSTLLFDTSVYTDQKDIDNFGVHECIRRVEVTDDSMILRVRIKDPYFLPLVEERVDKLRKTLGYCRDVCDKKSDVMIRPGNVKVIFMDKNESRLEEK